MPLSRNHGIESITEQITKYKVRVVKPAMAEEDKYSRGVIKGRPVSQGFR